MTTTIESFVQRAIVAAILSQVLACSDLTRVTNTSLPNPTQYDNPQGALARRAGALGAFAASVSAQVEESGLISDELTIVPGVGFSTFADLRVIEPTAPSNGAGYPYSGLSQTRLEALRAITSLRAYPATSRNRIGELFAVIAFTETYFAENLCSGVPLSSVVNDRPTIGPTLTRSQLWQRAASDFDSALANVIDTTGAPDSAVIRLALIGKARVLADSGDWPAATTLASAVPVGFAYQVSYGAGGGQQNQVATDVDFNGISVSDREGTNGLDFASANDPRVLTDSYSAGTQVTSHHYLPFLVSSGTTATASLTVASSTEAALLAAEGALRAGKIGVWTDALNALRLADSDTTLNRRPLPPDSTTGASPDTQVDVMFRERAFWLFLTGHRHEDLRRLVRQYGRSVTSVFPVGLYAPNPSQTYGSDVTFVPFGESGNKNFTGCFDRNA